MKDFTNAKLTDEDYVIEPFTIDNRNATILDDSFSVTIDSDDTISLNTHISLIGLKFIQDGYDVNSLRNETRSKKIKDYIGRELIKEYTLKEGLRKVLTLKTRLEKDKKKSFYVKCEEIEVVNNYCYDDSIINSDFNYFLSCLMQNFKYEGNHKLVLNLMGHYSFVLSKYLDLSEITYVIKDRFYTGPNFKRGSFTSPMRERDSFINQFIFLHYLKELLNEYYNYKFLLFQISKSEVSKDMGKAKIILPRDIEYK